MKALALADYMVTLAASKGEHLTNQQLQKILYYVEVWNLVYLGSLIDDEFEAWAQGPVIPEVYYHFEGFGSGPVSSDQSGDHSPEEKLARLEKELGLTGNQKALIEVVLLKYGKLDAAVLEALSHSDPAWRAARGKLKPKAAGNKRINKVLMRQHHKSIIS